MPTVAQPSLGYAFDDMAVTVLALLTDATNLTILPVLRDNTETIGVGWHCFKHWNVFVIATEKKMVMQKSIFLPHTLTLPPPPPQFSSLL